MSDKLVWSSDFTASYASGLGDEEKRNFLIDRGYDPEMLGDNDLDQVIRDDDSMWQDDSEEFEYEVAPMIARQTKDGIVIMFGQGARWDGTRQLGRAVDVWDLRGGDIDPDVTDIRIIDDGEGLVWEGAHHDGTHVMNLYAVPEDEDDLKMFISSCMFEAVRDRFEDESEAIEDLAKYITIEDINEWCDFELVPKYCQRIKNLGVNESLEESTMNEVKAKDPKGLRSEYIEIRDLADEYGREYFTSMPFTSYDNDPESVEMKYPNFFKVVKAFFKEMGILDAEELNDSDTLDLEWDQDINEHDWETLMKACDLITTKNKKKGTYDPYQFEKIYKDNYSDGLDDAKILADREKEDAEFEESLVEKMTVDELNKYETSHELDKFIKKYLDLDYPKEEIYDFIRHNNSFDDEDLEYVCELINQCDSVNENLDKDVEVEFECSDCGHTYKKKFGKDYFEDEADLENVMDQSEDDCPECGGHARAVGKENLEEAIDEVSVELDVVSDEDTPEGVISELRFFIPEEIKIEVVDMDGPGGGWPLVRYTGTKDNLLKYLPELGYDEDDILEFIGEDNLEEKVHEYDSQFDKDVDDALDSLDEPLEDSIYEDKEEDDFGPNEGPWGKF